MSDAERAMITFSEDTNPQGDNEIADASSKKGRARLAFYWEKKATKYVKNATTGILEQSTTARDSVSGILGLWLPASFVDYIGATPNYDFGITKNPPPDIGDFTRTFYNGFDDTTGRTISVKGYKRAARNPQTVAVNGCKVALGFKIGTKNRSILIHFPTFFTVSMITQAVNTMVRTTTNSHHPSYLSIGGTAYKFKQDLTAGTINTTSGQGCYYLTGTETLTIKNQGTGENYPSVGGAVIEMFGNSRQT